MSIFFNSYECLYFNVCSDRGCTCKLVDHTTVDKDIYRSMEQECIEELEYLNQLEAYDINYDYDDEDCDDTVEFVCSKCGANVYVSDEGICDNCYLIEEEPHLARVVQELLIDSCK